MQPDVGDTWDGEFAQLYIIARYEDYVWVHVQPKNKAFHPSLKTMSVLAFGELRKIS
jgi:hypothetical protein